MPTKRIQYEYFPGHLAASEPLKNDPGKLSDEQMILNIGPQHPSTHGVLRLEVVLEGEWVVEVVPHLGYLHRCFEKHTEALAYNQIIPYVDRMDYIAAMNSEHIYAMGVEKLLGIEDLGKRTEYIRVLVAELNRLASHFVAIGTYAMDIGAFTPFLWLMRDREHILRLLEWVCGSRMLYNYIWVGGLYYDLPIGFEDQASAFCAYLKPKLKELEELVVENTIFINRTANVGVLPLETAVNFGCSGPVLRGSGLKFDLRKEDAYSVYPEIEFDIPIGEGKMGTLGDCWDRNYVRVKECYESLKIIEQCLEKLNSEFKRDKNYKPWEFLPKKIRPKSQDLYFRGEGAKGELGFFFRTDPDERSDKPFRCKARSACFVNLSVLPEIAKDCLLADLIAIIGSLDMVMGEVDR
ncbi:MAG: NADH-quinone oxidoreductase subunit D [Cytophagales bacterium]